MEAFGREVPEAEGPASLDSSRGSGKGLLLIVTCPRCFSFDDVRPPRRLPDGRLEYTCTGEHDDTGAYMWSTASSAVDSPAGPTSTGRKAAARTAGRPRTSLVAEDAAVDELLEPLLACVNVGEPFVEYGVVEYRFRMSRQIRSSRTFVNGATPCSAHGVDRRRRRLLDSPGRSDGWKRRDSLSWSRAGYRSLAARPVDRLLGASAPPNGPSTHLVHVLRHPGPHCRVDRRRPGPSRHLPDRRTDHDPLRLHGTPADHSPQLRCGRLRIGVKTAASPTSRSRHEIKPPTSRRRSRGAGSQRPHPRHAARRTASL